jgi:hypothetical protein
MNFVKIAIVIKNKFMKEEIENLIRTLITENRNRTKMMNNPEVSQYTYTKKLIEFDNTVNIIKKLKTIIKNY